MGYRSAMVIGFPKEKKQEFLDGIGSAMSGDDWIDDVEIIEKDDLVIIAQLGYCWKFYNDWLLKVFDRIDEDYWDKEEDYFSLVIGEDGAFDEENSFGYYFDHVNYRTIIELE